MTTLYFFGDSWPSAVGEYDSIMKKQFDSFPVMVGKMLGLPAKIMAVQGSSIEHMIVQWGQADIKAGDHAVFCLTAPSRRMVIDHKNTISHKFVDLIKEAVNDYSDGWHAARNLALLYLLCEQKQIKPWFLNLFNVCYMDEYKNSLSDFVPPEHWIIPKDQCLVQTVFDPDWFGQYQHYRNSDFYDWLQTNNECVQKYIRPCKEHPNFEGRKIIADVITASIRQYLDVKHAQSQVTQPSREIQ